MAKIDGANDFLGQGRCKSFTLFEYPDGRVVVDTECLFGRKITWDPKNEQIVGDDQAAAFFARTPRKGFEIPRV